ncbi:MAG TPA: twin-arginine translocation signal domain-containing protein [Micromonosporaceae bacterium]
MSRRAFVTGVTAGVTAGLVGSLRTSRPAWAAATVDDLGIPLRDVLLIGGAVGPGPDGRPVLWSAVSGNPAHLAAIDPRTRRSVSYQPLDGAPGSYAVVVAPDGSVYVGAYSTGELYRRRPGKDSPVERLGRPLASETYIWRLAVDDDGILYGGTYPGGRVFRYDPATGHTRDYGTVLPGNMYVRSIAVLDGKIYAGTQPDTHVMEIDVVTGAMRELPRPAELGTGAGVTVYDLNAFDGRVWARFGSAINGLLGFWDVAAQRWSPLRDNVAGLDVSEPGPGGLVYYTRNARLTAFNPETGMETGTGLTFAGRVVNNRGIGWVTLADPAWPGRTLVGMLWRGELFRYNPLTGRSDVTLTDVPGEPIPLASLSVGVTGRLWAGGYLNGGVAQIDPDTGATDFHRFAQTESVLDLDDTVWLGAYPDARFYRYDPSAAWSSTEYSPGPAGTPENPVKVVDLKNLDQVRARASTDAAAWVAYGTLPNTTLGGALVIVDKATDVPRIHRPVVTDQSIVALTYADGLIIGGTSVYGGYSVPPPTQTEAVLFGFDPAADAKVFEVVAVPGTRTVDGLVTDTDGAVWVLAGGELSAFDVASRSVTRRVSLPASGGRLGYHRAGDTFYVHTGNELLRIRRADLAMTTVVRQPAQFLAVHPDGRVFLGDGPTVYRVTVE